MSKAASNAELANRLDRVESWQAIKDLVARYCHFVRTRQYDLIVQMYVLDGVFQAPGNMADGGLRVAGRP